MAFQAHSDTQYLLGLHWYICKGEDIKRAAARAGINPTVLWRAATGWTGNEKGGGRRDGDAGRAAFLAWLKALRSDSGAPCCGAHVVPGTKALPRLSTSEEHVNAAREAKAELEALQKQVARLQSKLGIREAHRAADSPPEDELPADEA